MKKFLVVILLLGMLAMPVLADVNIRLIPSGPRPISMYDFATTKAWWNGFAYSLVLFWDILCIDATALTVVEETTPGLGGSIDIPKLLSVIPGIDIDLGVLTIGGTGTYNFRNSYWMAGVSIGRAF